MEISKGIYIVETALWIAKERTLVINDLHIGYEGELQAKGILVPRFQLQQIIATIKSIIQQTKPRQIIINGDLKHEFGRISTTEWREVLRFLDFLLEQVEEVVIIQGNHDPIIKPIAEKRKAYVVQEYKLRDILIIHGDALVKTTAKRIIIGHEHPAVTIREGSKWEKYKCFLQGTWKGKELIAVPSFNPLVEGTDILKEEVLSPFLKEIQNFKIYIVSKGEVFDFGKVKDVSH